MSLQNTLHALADPGRRKILDLLKKGRLPAGEIAAQLPMTGATVSHHLAVLREADLVFAQKEGRSIYYELNASVLEEILLWIAELKGEGHAEKQPEADHPDLAGDPAAPAGGARAVGPPA